MALLADQIRFRKPTGNFVVDVIHVLETKGVQMISQRKSFDPAKARMLETPGENDVTVHPVLPNHESGEAHPNLECDSGFLR